MATSCDQRPWCLVPCYSDAHTWGKLRSGAGHSHAQGLSGRARIQTLVCHTPEPSLGVSRQKRGGRTF